MEEMSRTPPPCPATTSTPQHFVDDVFNAANEILEEAFDAMEDYAIRLLNITDQDTLQALSKGFDSAFTQVQGRLEKNLLRWESYCSAHCFGTAVQQPVQNKAIQDKQLVKKINTEGPNEEDLDAELQALRTQLAAASKESIKLRRELRSLERGVEMKRKQEVAIQDALKQLDETITQDIFEELIGTANELRERLNKYKSERSQTPRTRGVSSRRKAGFTFNDSRMKDIEAVAKNLSMSFCNRS